MPKFAKVLRAGQARIDDPPPVQYLTFLDREQRFFPIGVDHHVEILALLRGTGEENCQAIKSRMTDPLLSPRHTTARPAPKAAATERRMGL